MDVSNSTGQGTGYRVLGAGGVEPDLDRRRSKKLIKIEGRWYEVLREGTLEPNTYVSVKVHPDQACMVEFKVGDQAIRHSMDPKPAAAEAAEAAAEEKPAKPEQPAEILVALAKNGQDTPKTMVFRKAL